MNNIKISAFSDFTPDGSLYDDVTISGMGDVNGSVNCKTLTISGCGNVNGSVKCEKHVHISGTGGIDGSVVCGGELICSGCGEIGGDVLCKGSLKMSGTADIHGNIECKEATLSGAGDIMGSLKCAERVDISGTGNVKGDINAEKVVMSGSTTAKKNVSCESAQISGTTEINGLLNAEEIHIVLGNVNICEIGCTKLSVVAKDKKRGQLCCKTIEGDEISLVNTSAEVVRGKNVKIGPMCNVDVVEYSDTLEIDSEAAVGTQNKI